MVNNLVGEETLIFPMGCWDGMYTLEVLGHVYRLGLGTTILQVSKCFIIYKKNHLGNKLLLISIN